MYFDTMETPQVPPRMPHRKSRNGCTRCKQRCVKCDEQVPCTACVRHQVSCSLTNHATGSTHRRASRSRPPAHNTQGTTGKTTLDLTALNPLQSSLSAFDTHDCFVSISELMSHWTTRAHASMGTPEDPDTLQIDIPQVAFAHPYLLRGILAFSAFHLAYLDSAQPSKYRLIALRHQHLSLRGLREALQQATSENCHALYLTAILLVVTKFASFPDCTHHHAQSCGAPIQSLVEAFSVCAGVATIKDLFSDDLARGPFQFFFHKRSMSETSNGLLPFLLEQLSNLKTIAESQHDEPIIVATIDKLIACSVNIQSRPQPAAPPEFSCIYVWPMHMPAPFLDLAAKRDPAAMSVLAHYCVLIHWGGRGFWCFEDCSASLMKEIASELRGSPWESALEYPLKVTAEN